MLKEIAKRSSPRPQQKGGPSRHGVDMSRPPYVLCGRRQQQHGFKSQSDLSCPVVPFLGVRVVIFCVFSTQKSKNCPKSDLSTEGRPPLLPVLLGAIF